MGPRTIRCLLLVPLVSLSCMPAVSSSRHAPDQEIADGAETELPRSQFEVRAIQTRVFSEGETTTVMKALLDVLQDDGFVVRNAVIELGLLSAVKERDVSTSGQAFLQTLLFGAEGRWNKNSIIEATANVTAAGGNTRVRISFRVKTMNNRGEVVGLKEITDPKYYQAFFAKVDKGLFIRKQGL